MSKTNGLPKLLGNELDSIKIKTGNDHLTEIKSILYAESKREATATTKLPADPKSQIV